MCSSDLLQQLRPGVEDSEVRKQIEIQAKYQGYITRQQEEVSRLEAQEQTRLPADLDYRLVRGLSIEAQQKLNQYKPETIGKASRISGITPAAVSLLLVHLKKGFPKGAETNDRTAA